MKNFQLVLAILFISCSLSAQTTTYNTVEKPIKNEIGANATLFFRQFLNSNNATNFPDNPYLITYKRHFQRFILRGGLGIDINTATESNQKFADTRTRLINNYNYRVGYEKPFPLMKKIRGYWALDLVGAQLTNELRIDSGFDIVSTSENTWGAGGGAVLGFEYAFSNNFSLATETAYYYRREWFKEQSKFSNNPSFNDSGKKIVRNKAQFLPPVSIFAVLKF